MQRWENFAYHTNRLRALLLRKGQAVEEIASSLQSLLLRCPC